MTSKVQIKQIKQRLEEILTYMQPYWEFVNCHMVNYLTDRHWEHFVPAVLRAEVCDIQQVQRCIETVFWCNNSRSDGNFAAFRKFIAESEKHRLNQFPDVLTSLQDLRQKLGVKQENENISIKEFMSEKKRHEVEITAELVNDLVQHVQCKNSIADVYIIDAGDGKGYLSSRLSLQYQHKVLGIDFNEANTENAQERNRRLQRSWTALTVRAELESKGITPPRRGKGPKRNPKSNDNNTDATQNYKTTSQFISPELDFMQLLKEFFPQPSNEAQLCLTGLHTCGNLAPTCLKVFHAQRHFNILCNIGCCYHLLKEEFSGQEFFGNKAIMDMQCEAGFPMSTFLRERRVSLGRNARMLAAQSIERTVAAQELPNISLYYRSLLEVALCEHDISLKDTVQVGKVRKFENFPHYLELCNRKAQLGLDSLSLEHIRNLEATYATDKNYLDLFYLLRMTFAPVLESLILLDRLLYLQELNYEQSFLVSLFDAVKSPRHYCIAAIKS